MYTVRKFSFAFTRKSGNQVPRYYCILVLFKIVFRLRYAVNYSRLFLKQSKGTGALCFDLVYVLAAVFKLHVLHSCDYI
jgi:hypothetical protein